MRCEDISAKSVDYLAGTLADSERHEFDSHLRTCATCRAELDGLTQTWTTLGEIPPVQPDAAAMRARFETLLTGAAPEPRPQQHRRRIGAWFPRPASLRPLLQACAALLLVLVGIQLGREIRPSGSPEVRELSQEVRDLRQMVTLSLMQQQSASERLKGVSWSNQLDRPGNEVVTALIDTLMHDANVNVRLASIDALKRFAERDVVRNAAVHALDTQNSPLVQMALIDFVVETQDRGAIDTLRRLAHDDTINATVRARAAWGVDHLETA
jgi:hypothetical protein